MSPTRSFEVLGGKLEVTGEERLEFVRGRRMPGWGWVLGAAAVLCALWSRVLGGTENAGVVSALVWAIPSFALAGLVEWFALARSRMVVPRWRLTIERVEGRSYRDRTRFVARVDGVAVETNSARMLYEIRHAGLVLHVVAMGATVIVLSRCVRYDGKFSLATEQSRATSALLRADHGFDGEYLRESVVPLVQATARVLDLKPAQTWGDVDSDPLRAAGRYSDADRAGPEASGRLLALNMWTLGLLDAGWHSVVWIVLAPRLLALGPVGATCAFLTWMIVPPVLVFAAVGGWFYARPLRAKVAEIVVRAREDSLPRRLSV